MSARSLELCLMGGNVPAQFWLVAYAAKQVSAKTCVCCLVRMHAKVCSGDLVCTFGTPARQGMAGMCVLLFVLLVQHLVSVGPV